MNFKTTLILFAVLVVVGLLALLANRDSSEPVETPKEVKLIDLDSRDVSKLTVTSADGQRMVLEKSGSDWKLVEPIKAAADTSAVDALLRGLVDLTSRGQSSASLAELGLDKPSYVVEIQANSKTHKLNVGKKALAGGDLFVQLDGQSKGTVVPADVYDQLEEPYTQYRQTKLVSASAADIKQIEIDRPEGKLVLLNKGENWQITQPQAMPAEASEVSSLTYALTGLTAAEFVKESDIPAGLHPDKNTRLTVWYSTAAPSTQPSAPPATQGSGVRVRFGDYDSLLKKNLYVAVSEPAVLAKVPASAIDAFNKQPLDLRDRKVVEIDPAQVSRISITTDTPSTTQPTTRPASHTVLAIERKKQTVAATQPSTQPTTAPALPPSDWTLAGPNAGDASQAKVSDLLSKFNPLRAEKYLASAPAPSEPIRYTVEIAVQAAGGASSGVHTIQLSDPGQDKPLIGQYNGLFFELPRTLLDALTGDFANKPADHP